MKKKTLWIIIAIILVVIIIAGVVIGIVMHNNKENGTVGSVWGDTYYTYLKDAISEDAEQIEEKYGIKVDIEDAKLQFCKVEENQDPTMVMSYIKDDESYVNIYQINNDKKVVYVAYDKTTDVEYLYDIAKDEYLWYLHTDSENNDEYTTLKNIVSKLKEQSEESSNENILEIEPDYIISKDESEVSQETTDGETITYSKFDEIFVKPEIEINKQIDFYIDGKIEDLKNEFLDIVSNYKEEKEKLTDEVKNVVNEKVENIKSKIEKVKSAEEEIIKIEKYADLYVSKIVSAQLSYYTLEDIDGDGVLELLAKSGNDSKPDFKIYKIENDELKEISDAQFKTTFNGIKSLSKTDSGAYIVTGYGDFYEDENIIVYTPDLAYIKDGKYVEYVKQRSMDADTMSSSIIRKYEYDLTTLNITDKKYSYSIDSSYNLVSTEYETDVSNTKQEIGTGTQEVKFYQNTFSEWEHDNTELKTQVEALIKSNIN